MLGFRKKHKQNDDDFIVELYKLYSAVVKKTVYAKLYSKSIEDIEDCVQTVFVIAVEKLEELRVHPNIIGWFTVVAKNVSMKKNEKFLKEKCVSYEDFEACPDSLRLDEQVIEDVTFEELVKGNAVNKVLEKLNVEEKELYRLRWVNRLSYSEIEGELDLSSGAVKSRIMRLKRHIETEVKSFTG